MAQSPHHRTVKLFKPFDVLTQFTDESGRATLKQFVPLPSLYPVGRLDRDSEGLILLTDDGRLAHRLTDPRFEHPKTYLVQVEGLPTPEALDALRGGLVLNDGPTRPAVVTLLGAEPDLPERPVPIRFRKNVPTSWLRLTIREGRNRQVRRMTAAVGLPTLRLVRVAVGPISLGDLAPGEWRDLTADEATRWRRPSVTDRGAGRYSPRAEGDESDRIDEGPAAMSRDETLKRILEGGIVRRGPGRVGRAAGGGR